MTQLINEIKLKYYLSEVKKHQRLEDGWVLDGHTDGDAIMFNSMLYAASRILGTLKGVRILAAVSSKGQVYRKPIESGNAYPTISKSEISRDMILGMFFGLEVGNFEYIKALAKEVLSYSKDNYGVLGKGLLTRTRMTHNLKTLLTRISGNRKWYQMYIPSIPMSGYQAHLDVLSIYLRFRTGKIGLFDKWRLKRYVKKQNQNLLFFVINALIQGNLDEAIENNKDGFEILDMVLFPANRLPNSFDHSTHYLWQRDQYSSDWQPDTLNKIITHIPYDYLIVMTLLKKYL